MFKLNDEQFAALEQLSVHVDIQESCLETLKSAMSEMGSRVLFEKVTELSSAPTDTVTTSVFMRRYGFFIAAQLHMLSEHNLLWCGKLNEISIFVENETIMFSVPSTSFRQVCNREEDIRFILESYGHPVVDYFSKRGKIAKLILWENIWGYVLWMYSTALEAGSANAQHDIDLLLQDEIWKPAMRRSPFKQYIKNQPAIEAMANYKRVTCCLYKELPGTDKCPYCPLAK